MFVLSQICAHIYCHRFFPLWTPRPRLADWLVFLPAKSSLVRTPPPAPFRLVSRVFSPIVLFALSRGQLKGEQTSKNIVDRNGNFFARPERSNRHFSLAVYNSYVLVYELAGRRCPRSPHNNQERGRKLIQNVPAYRSFIFFIII